MSTSLHKHTINIQEHALTTKCMLKFIPRAFLTKCFIFFLDTHKLDRLLLGLYFTQWFSNTRVKGFYLQLGNGCTE